MAKIYYLNANNEQQGPVSPTAFKDLGITAETFVWYEGLAQWTPAGHIPNLAPYLGPPSAPIEAVAGQSLGDGYDHAPEKPSNGLAGAILSTIFCGPFAGVYAIVKAAQVDYLYNRGRFEEAQDCASKAKKWAGLNILFGILFLMAYFGFILLIANA